MSEPIEEVYFKWLYQQVASVEHPTPSLTFYTLLRDLHSTEFVWLLSGDDNRAADGLDLRKEFLRQTRREDAAWLSIPCSVLEMMIAFSRKAEWNTEIEAEEWFWIFLANLHLDGCNDAQEDITMFVSDVMDQFLWRTYDPSGVGGMFPLDRPEHDQRKVEIWYQFCQYLVDHDIS